MRRAVTVPVLLCVLAAGCAPSGSTQRRDPSPQLGGLGEVNRQGNVREATPEGGMLSEVVEAPPAAVFAAVMEVYGDLGIEMPEVDRRLMRVQNPAYTVSRRLLDRRVSYFLRCGEGITGPNADSFRITMHIFTSVQPEGTGSRVGTEVAASGRNPRGTSNAVMPCASTFRFERRIMEAVKAKVAEGVGV